MASKTVTAFKPPFLSKESIELAASNLLSVFSREQKINLVPPIPVEDILEKHLKLIWEFKDMAKFLGQPDVLGGTWIDDNIVRIDNSLEEHLGRFSFTMAHEIGHWELHRPMLLQKRDRNIKRSESNSSELPTFICRSKSRERAEKQADIFASRLLMPEHLIRTTAKRLFPEGFKPPRGLLTTAQFIKGDAEEQMIEIGGFSNCSKESMRYRLRELNILDKFGRIAVT